LNIYLICYDISDDDLRRRVSILLGRHGNRVQRSVFEVRIGDSGHLEQLRAQLIALLDPEPEAELRFYRLCARCRAASATLAGEPVANFPETIIV